MKQAMTSKEKNGELVIKKRDGKKLETKKNTLDFVEFGFDIDF